MFSRTQSASAVALNEILTRRASVTAEDVRHDICEAFQKVDTDSSGAISRDELVELVQGLHIPLKDLAMDIDALLEFMDPAHTNQIGLREFSNCFEPFIRDHEAKGIEMEIDEIMKDAISNVLCNVRTQRNYVNATFLEASQKIEKEKKGFGVNFWGSCWRFKMYEDFYGAPKTHDGSVLPYSMRYSNLKSRLAGVIKGSDPWIFATTASDAKIKKEISHPEGVQLFCKEWLQNLEREERECAKQTEKKKEAAKDVSG